MIRYQPVRLLILATGLICGTFAACYVGDSDTTKQPDLKKIVAETPVFPGFAEVQPSDYIGKPEIAVLTCFYRSPASYDAVKIFYVDALIKQGWSQPREEVVPKWFVNDGSKEMIFIRGEYSIGIEYDAAKNAEVPYSVSFRWDKGGRL